MGGFIGDSFFFHMLCIGDGLRQPPPRPVAILPHYIILTLPLEFHILLGGRSVVILGENDHLSCQAATWAWALGFVGGSKLPWKASHSGGTWAGIDHEVCSEGVECVLGLMLLRIFGFWDRFLSGSLKVVEVKLALSLV